MQPLNRTLTVAVSIPTLTTLLLLGGCEGEEGQVRVQSQQKLDAANDALREAQVLLAPRPGPETGYDPEMMMSVGERPDAYALRREQMQAVIKDLDAVIAKGEPDQKATAHQLKATILASLARSQRRDADEARVAVAERMGALSNRLVTASRRARVNQSLEGEGTLSQAKLSEAMQKAQLDLQEVQSRRQPLLQQKKQLTQERDQLAGEAEAARGEAERLEQQAFTAADAQATFDLQTKAAEARRRADEATKERDLRVVALGQVERDLRPLEKQNEAQQRLVADLTALVKTARDADIARDRDRMDGEQVLGADLDEVRAKLDEALAMYEQQVAGPYEQAATRLESSVQALEAAQKAGAGASVDADLLDRLVDLAAVYSGHASGARRVAESLSVMQDSLSRVPGADLELDQRLASVQAQIDSMQTKIEAVATRANTVADQLKSRGGGDRIAETIEGQRGLVSSYQSSAAGNDPPAIRKATPAPTPEEAPPPEPAASSEQPAA